MRIIALVFLSLFFGSVIAQEKTFTSEEVSIPPFVDGTLLTPSSEKVPLAIIIAGSGPTDRNGNQSMMKSNSLRLLAQGLYDQNIATYRYDKRLFKIMKSGKIIEEKIKFDHFVEDAVAVVEHFKNDPRFSKIYVIGHSQGSLVGMVAAQSGANGFISLAGAGRSIDAVIVAQLEKQAPGLKDSARQAFDEIKANGSTDNYSPGLASIFRPSIQPFLGNWMTYNPQEEIKKLAVPVLIINGDKDLQVHVSEAEILHASKPDATYEIIPFMNHIFKEIKGDDLENSKSYNIYNLPVMPQLIESISTFIKK
jgi:pimeloyl-ACP methyl ester carboxylesterase